MTIPAFFAGFPDDSGGFFTILNDFSVQKVLVKMACILPYYLIK